jgi:hypothetical protein
MFNRDDKGRVESESDSRSISRRASGFGEGVNDRIDRLSCKSDQLLVWQGERVEWSLMVRYCSANGKRRPCNPFCIARSNCSSIYRSCRIRRLLRVRCESARISIACTMRYSSVFLSSKS